MLELLLKLLTPKLLAVYGPMAVMCVVLGIALAYLWKRHETLHEERLSDAINMKTEYVELVTQLEKTIDTLIQVVAKRGK